MKVTCFAFSESYPSFDILYLSSQALLYSYSGNLTRNPYCKYFYSFPNMHLNKLMHNFQSSFPYMLNGRTFDMSKNTHNCNPQILMLSQQPLFCLIEFLLLLAMQPLRSI